MSNRESMLLSRLLTLLLILVCLAACGGRAVSPNPPSPTAILSTDFSWLRIAYPPGWHKTAPNQYEGADGYAWLELRESGGAGPGAVCMGEANRGKPRTYGAYPEIRDLRLAEQPACLILSSPDQPAARREESLYLLWVPASIRAGTLLALHADRAHILAISQSLAFSQASAGATPAPCDFSPYGSPAHTTHPAGLRVDEFPIALSKAPAGEAPGISPACSPYSEPLHFNQRTQSGPAAARAGQLKNRQYSSERLASLNQRLDRYRFRVESADQLFTILRHGTAVRTKLSWVGQLSVRANNQDFILPAVDSYNAATYILRADGVHPTEGVDLLAFDLVFPVYAGPDRISLAYDYQQIPRPTGSPALLQIKKYDELIETLSVSGSNPANGPVRGLWSWGDHWVLELPGLVIEDGEILNDRLGYPEMFTWRMLRDGSSEKPFYFYRKNGQVHAVYDNQTLPDPYDEVLYEPQWTDRMLVQLRTYESGLVFYARRGDTWYYVVMESE